MKPKLLLGLALVLSGAASIAIIFFWLQPPASEKHSGAAMHGNLDRPEKLEAKDVSLDAKNQHAFGWTPLMAAIYTQQTNVIQYLLTRNVNLNPQDISGSTALMWAISMDDTNTVRLLLEKGADVPIAGTSGDALSAANVTSGNARVHRELFVEWLNAYKEK